MLNNDRKLLNSLIVSKIISTFALSKSNKVLIKKKVMKQINLFTSNLISEKSETKKAVHAALADYEKAIDGAFTAVIKSEDRRARNVANAAKGKYHTAIEVVAACYPYQTADGILCSKKKIDDGTRVWSEKKLTAAAARGIVRESLNNFTKYVGEPEITYVTIGDTIE